MSRAPYNVLVLPYYFNEENIEYCIFKRSDLKIWQFISGGGEDNESPQQAAIRESFEEAGILNNNKYNKLVSMCYVPVENFSEAARETWGDSLVIPVYSFSVNLDTKKITISDEHTEFKWCKYEEAKESLYFDLDKTALFELNGLLKKNEKSF